MEKEIQETIDYIKTINELSDEEKNEFIERIQNDKNPLDVLDDVEDKLQDKLNTVFNEEGVKLDENDLEYKMAKEKMIEEVRMAESEFNQEMSEIEKESDKIQEETLRETDDIKAQILKDQLIG